MENLEQLRRQLDNLSDLHGLVRTMKALSAASIRQYERAVEALDGYYRTVEQGLRVALHEQPEQASIQAPVHQAVLLFGTDQGLCGRLNEDLCDYALAQLDAQGIAPAQRQLLVVGERLAGELSHRGQPPAASFPVPGSAVQITRTIQTLLAQLGDDAQLAASRGLQLFHNRPVDSGLYQPCGQQLLPIDWHSFEPLSRTPWPARSHPTTFEPGATLRRHLIHQYLFVSVFRACAESQASEHASRLATLQAAERHLDDRRTDLTNLYRRARQGVITAELLDVVSGFEALNQPQR